MLPTACEEKTNAEGDTFNSGAAAIAVPVIGIVCIASGRFPELSVMFTTAVNVPVLDGTKDMTNPQLAPAVRPAGHVSADGGN